MRSYWWGVMAGAALYGQYALARVNPDLLVPPVYWLMGVVALVGHLWLWWSDDMD